MDIPKEQQVFLALQDVLGQDAEGWRQKKVKTYIERNKIRQEVRTVLERYGMPEVCKIVRALLKRGAFRSPLHANTPPSEAITVSSDRSDQLTTATSLSNTGPETVLSAAQNSQQGPASAIEGTSASAIEGTSAESYGGPQGDDNETHSAIQTLNDARPTSQTASDPPVPRRRTVAPSLHPIYLPLPTQLRLLKQMQETLERSLYSFASGKLQTLLQTRGWDCAECVELHVWSSLLMTQKTSIPNQRLSSLRKPWNDTLRSMAEIRHAAVHRIRLPVSKLVDSLLDAESLLGALGDDVARGELARLRQNMQETVERIERNQDLLESAIAGVLRDFAAQKARIEKLERAAVEGVLEEDKAYRVVAAVALDRAVSELRVDATSTRGGEFSDSREEYYDAVEFAG